MSCISLAGWLSGVFNAVKLLYSFSTSGPSSTLNPISENIEEISSITWETGCTFPWLKLLSGKVISNFSFCSFELIFLFSISSNPIFNWFCNSSFIRLSSDANFFLSSADIDPIFLNSNAMTPFFPNSSVLIWFKLFYKRVFWSKKNKYEI